MNIFIPDEILSTIFLYFHGGMILRCSIVCRQWKRAAEVDWLWKIIISRELDDEKIYNKKQNIEINKQIALKWGKKYNKSLKDIYVAKRRKLGQDIKYRIFPIPKPLYYSEPVQEINYDNLLDLINIKTSNINISKIDKLRENEALLPQAKMRRLSLLTKKDEDEDD